MLKILFSPSETKSTFSPAIVNLKNALWKAEKFHLRFKYIELYNKIIQDNNTEELSKLFGIKNEISKFSSINIHSCPAQKAILRYIGTAYKSLNYLCLDKNAQEFIDENVMIFSNLFGPVLAGNFLPCYKIKQGESLRGFDIGAHCKKGFESDIDKWLAGELTIDLRAAFYEKFYQLKTSHITMKFYKNGKILSHFAKAYRGLILQELSICRPCDMEEFQEINFPNLVIRDIKKSSLKTEYSYDIK
ncbi:MAG: YaaA family protein [Campylobacteraceae bacterium]|jgi:cytoplasmic iron level regulating protein YaaA (DUF328/UPF0246 family)|nr:YaaA family protein [Campylobacteraceae bacterium]